MTHGTKRILHYWTCIIFLVFAILIFHQGADAETDMLGRQVSLKTAPERIVSLAPSCTEIIAALGLQEKLVGITEHTDYPPEVLNLPKVGSYVNLNLEAIAMLRPDLVVATEDGNPEETINSLQKLSIPVYVLKLRTYETIQDSILSLGKFVGRKKEADIAVESMRSVASCISDKTSRTKRFSVLWVYDQYPIVSAGRDTFTNQLIQMAGGDSITADVSISYPRLTIENVIARNPDVIVVTSMDPSRDRKEREEWWNKWSMIHAVKNKRVYVMQSSLLDRPSPRVVYGLAQLAKTFHPEVFSSDSCQGKN
jgi:iron complex transport system substrate-binding protein